MENQTWVASTESNTSACFDLADPNQRPGDWLNNSLIRKLVIIAYMVLITLSILSNTWIVISICASSSLRTVRNLFIVSLALADLLVITISGVVTPIDLITKQWYFGPFMCRMVTLIQGTSIGVMTYSLSAIAIDRYIVIVRVHANAWQSKDCLLLICVIWVLSALSVSPPVIYRDLRPVSNFCGEICSEIWPETAGVFRKAYGYLALFGQFLIPFTIITFCYVHICQAAERALRFRMRHRPVPTAQTTAIVDENNSSIINETVENQNITTNKSSNQANANLLKATKRHQQMNRVLFSVVLLFALCWIPHCLLCLLKDLQQVPLFVIHQHFFFACLSHFLAMCSTLSNAILYGAFNAQLRAKWKSQLRIERLRNRNGQNVDAKTTMNANVSNVNVNVNRNLNHRFSARNMGQRLQDFKISSPLMKETTSLSNTKKNVIVRDTHQERRRQMSMDSNMKKSVHKHELTVHLKGNNEDIELV